MLRIPQRLSLSAQAASAIRRRIETQVWQEFLPGMRRLCEIFHVSRPTIRTALRILADDGLIEIRRARRNRVLSRASVRRSPRRLVVLITHEEESSYTSHGGVNEMRIRLAEENFETEVLICPNRQPEVQRRWLERLIQQRPVLCCLLLSVSRPVQEWFAARAFPALVLGTCHPSIRLPALDVDNRSVCRHASGLLLAKGHRSLALLLPTSVAAGTLASEQGFLESIRLRPSPEKIHTRVARHRSTTRSVERLLDGFFKGTEPPTALVVAPAEQVLPVFFYLLRRNLLEKVSLISRDQHHLWADLSPAISHYGFEEQMLSDRLARLMLQLVNQGYLSTKPNLIYRRFFPGGTVSRPA